MKGKPHSSLIGNQALRPAGRISIERRSPGASKQICRSGIADIDNQALKWAKVLSENLPLSIRLGIPNPDELAMLLNGSFMLTASVRRRLEVDRIAGFVEVERTNDTHEIIISHPVLHSDPSGLDRIVLSARHARHLANVLILEATHAEAELAGRYAECRPYHRRNEIGRA